MIGNKDNKRIAKNTLLLYFRMLLTMVVSLYTSRIVLNVLGVADFGIYNVVGGIVTMFSFLNGAMGAATSRYFTYFIGTGDSKQLNKVFNMAVLIHVVIALIIVILGETVGLWYLQNKIVLPSSRHYAAEWLYQFSIANMVLLIISVPYNSAIIAFEKMNAFAYLSIIDVLFKLGVVFVIKFASFDKLILYGFLLLSIQVFDRVIYGLYCSKKFKECKSYFFWDKSLFKEMISFASWNLFGNFAFIGYSQGLNLLLNAFFGPVVNAARAIALQVQGVIIQFSQNFQMALNPQITKSYASNSFDRMYMLIIVSAKYSFYLLLLLTLPIFIEADQIIRLWLGQLPEHSVSFLRLILICSIIDITSNSLNVAAQSTGRIRSYKIVEGCLLVLILPVSYLTLKLGALPEVVYIVNLVFFIITFMARLFMIKLMLDFPVKVFFKDVVLRIVLVVTVSSILPFLLYTFLQGSLLRLSLSILTSVISCSVAIYFIGMAESERVVLKEKVPSLIQQFKGKIK